MGYYSTYYPGQFKSRYSLDELNEWFEKFRETKIKEGNTDIEYLDIYDIENVSDNLFEVVAKEDEFYGKHYADRLLAEFISLVIDDDDECIIEFIGEDGERWGYYIQKEIVRNAEYKMQRGSFIIRTDINKYFGDNK